jgi:hypothetical protein
VGRRAVTEVANDRDETIVWTGQGFGELVEPALIRSRDGDGRSLRKEARDC